MARIFLILAVVFGIAAGALSFMIEGQRVAFRTDRDDKAAKLVTTTKNLVDTKKTLDETQATLQTTKDSLDETTKKAAQLEDDLNTAKTRAATLDDTVKQDEAKLAQAAQDAADLQAKLGAESDAAKKAQANVADLEDKLRIKTDDLAAANAEVTRLVKLKEDALKGKMPPGIVGQVLEVNTNWNFVVLNIGELQGVVPNGELLISRHDGTYIGKVRVANTEKNTCVADILLESLSGKGPVEVGDSAGN